MTTSSTTSWELTRNEIIDSALRKCQVLAKGQTPATEDYEDCTEALNSLLQTLATKGMPLWKRTTQSITPSATTDYTVSNVWKIVQVIMSDDTGGTQIELYPKSLYDYNRLPTDTTGMPTQYCVLPGLENATLRVWPTPDAGTISSKTIKVVYQKEFFSFSSSTDTPDFPAYWTDAIIYSLAVRIAPEYGVPLPDRQALAKEAKEYVEAAQGYGDEDGSLYFMPDRTR